MKVAPIKTQTVLPNSISLIELIDKYVTEMTEESVLAITSKVVSVCENRVVDVGSADKEDLIKQEATYYLPSDISKFGNHFTITNNTLISGAGIDESNSNGQYVLWPKDSQATANMVRKHLKEKFNIKKIGVVITDSTCTPFRLGTTGIALAYSGFSALKSYIGEPDLFGRPYKISRSNIAGGLASTAVLIMGEGTEQTPLIMISELNFVDFEDEDPNSAELEGLNIKLEDDLFEPFLNTLNWQSKKDN